MPETQETAAKLRKEGAERRLITDHIAYFDSLVDAKPMEIPPGKSRCSNLKDVMLVTTVGSGIGVCIHEAGIEAGGLGHFILSPDIIANFPNVADKEADINKLLSHSVGAIIDTLVQLGGQPSRMRAKVFGGGQLEDSPEDSGHKISIMVKEYLVRNGVYIASEDVGQPMGRRIQFIPVTGQGMRRLLKRGSDVEELSKIERDFFAG